MNKKNLNSKILFSKRIVVLIGKSASGKDAIKEELCKNYEFQYVVPYTTRPMRENEVDGKDYHFIKEGDEDFRDRVVRGDFLEHRFFHFIKDGKKCWVGYATPKIKERKGNFVIVNSIKGAEIIAARCRINKCLIVYLDADDEVRKNRAIQRDKNFENAEWQRRLKTDTKDYSEERLSKIGALRINTTNKSAAEIANEINEKSIELYLECQKNRMALIKKRKEMRNKKLAGNNE